MRLLGYSAIITLMTTENTESVNNMHAAEAQAGKAAAEGFQTSADKAKAEWENSTEAKGPQAKTEIAKLQDKYDELDDKYKRLWADQQNMSKRMQAERDDLYKYAAQNTIEALLPALDNFDFAKKSITEETKFEDVIKSFDMLKVQLMMSLQSVGLEEIATTGTFNPELHEAVAKVNDADKPEGSILEVAKLGYKLNNKVIRVASVVVSTQEEG